MSALDWIELLYVNRDWLTLFAIFTVVFSVIAAGGIAAGRAVRRLEKWAEERGYEKGFDRGYLVGRQEERSIKAVETSDPMGMEALMRFYQGPLGRRWAGDVVTPSCDEDGGPSLRNAQDDSEERGSL